LVRGPYASKTLQSPERKEVLDMSRKALFFAAVVAVLVATFAAPVTAAPLNGEAVVSERSEGWSEIGVNSSVVPAPVLPAGDCEGGAGGGCPTFD
jgi:hypothetical protein